MAPWNGPNNVASNVFSRMWNDLSSDVRPSVQALLCRRRSAKRRKKTEPFSRRTLAIPGTSLSCGLT